MSLQESGEMYLESILILSLDTFKLDVFFAEYQSAGKAV